MSSAPAPKRCCRRRCPRPLTNMTLSPPAPTTSDFPDWIGPILVKELRRGLKTRAFVLSFVGLQAIFVLTLVFNAILYSQKPAEFDPSGLHTVFWMLVGAQLVVITPLRALNEIAGERKAATLELIYMTSLTSWRIVFGKWVSLLFQNLLFLAAVLPYGILRYYFGSVNLLEDLSMLGWMLLGSTVLSALAIAISGMPLPVRIGVIVIGVLLLPSLSMGVAFGMRGGASFSMEDVAWPVIVWNAAVVVALALDLAAQSIAPPAENHAGVQRMVSLAALLPVPLMMLLRAGDDVIFSQLMFFAVLSFFTVLHQTASFWSPIRPHLAPYAKLGAPGFALAVLILPGAASAALYLLLCAGIVIGLGTHIAAGSAQHELFVARILLAGAALLTAPVLYRALRRYSRTAVAEYFLFFILAGVIASFVRVLGNDHPFDVPWLAAFPPVGVWFIRDPASGSKVYWWCIAGWISFAAYWTVLELLMLPYWRYTWALFEDIRRNKQSETSALARSGSAA